MYSRWLDRALYESYNDTGAGSQPDSIQSRNMDVHQNDANASRFCSVEGAALLVQDNRAKTGKSQARVGGRTTVDRKPGNGESTE